MAMLASTLPSSPHRSPDRTAERIAARLSALSDVLRLDGEHVVAGFRRIVAPWTIERPASTSWSSEISDDHTPIEMSVTLERDEAALRLLFEPLGDEPTLEAARAAGLAFHDEIASRF